MLKYQIFFLAMMLMVIVLVDSGKIPFEDCGNHELKSIEVDGCSMNKPCILHPGQTVKVAVQFKANSASQKATLKSIATINGHDKPLKIDPDACKVIKCPLVKGQLYTAKYSYVLPANTPFTKNLIVTGTLKGDKDHLLACGKTKGEVAKN